MGPGEVKYFPTSRSIVGYPPTARDRVAVGAARTIRRVLADGTYDAIVVDAEEGSEPGWMRLELAIASGAHKGEIVSVTGSDPAYASSDPLDLLAIPATIVVTDGSPAVTLEP